MRSVIYMHYQVEASYLEEGSLLGQRSHRTVIWSKFLSKFVLLDASVVWVGKPSNGRN